MEIERFDPRGGDPPRWETYEVPYDDSTSLLDAILWLRAYRDPTLSIRYACRGANTCRQCLASVNGKTEYLCTIGLDRFLREQREKGKGIRIKALANRPRHRDLWVDLES